MPIIVDTNLNFEERKQGIRNMVAIGLSQNSDLSDNDITNDAILGHANRYVARRVPNFADLEGVDRADLEVAVSKIAAVELLKSSPRYSQYNAQSVQDRQVFLEIKDTIEMFLADAAEIITDLSPEVAGTATPYFYVIDITPDKEDY